MLNCAGGGIVTTEDPRYVTPTDPNADAPLLATKLHPPRRRRTVVARPRLVDLADRSRTRALTLVSAPAGFGKTTLVADWFGAHGATAWVSLDPRDEACTVLDLDVIDDPAAAITALDPVRTRILAHLAEPGSATTLAAQLGMSRQTANYHLRVLESHGLVEVVEERPRRGLTERVVQATASAYLVAPDVIDQHAVDPSRVDRLSSRYLLALAARMVKEVLDLSRRAERSHTTLPTLAIDTDVRFRSAAERAAFTAELAAAMRDLAARYHDETAPRGRWHRLVVAAHPHPDPPPEPRGEP